MSEYGRDLGQTANRAFASPTSLAASRLGKRISPSTSAPSSGMSLSGRSTTSRRSASVITTQDEADLFNQMSQATSVKVRNKKNRVERVGSPTRDLLRTGGGAADHTSSTGLHDGHVRAIDLSSPTSNDHAESFDYGSENYFSPGGTLSIPSPGRPEEKTFNWNSSRPYATSSKHSDDSLDVPQLDEKKTGDDGDEVPRSIPVPSFPPTQSPFPTTMSTAAIDATDEENKKVLASLFKMTKEAAKETPSAIQSNVPANNSDPEVAHVGTLDETSVYAEGSISTAPSHLDESHRGIVKVETVTGSCK